VIVEGEFAVIETGREQGHPRRAGSEAEAVRDGIAARGTSVISFVWTPWQRLPAGTGGSENYTVGQVRELNRRGVAAQVVTVGLGTADGREEFSDIPFRSLADVSDVGDLAGTVVFATDFPAVTTRRPPYQMLHVPPPLREPERSEVIARTRDRVLVATSRFGASLWAAFLDVDVATIAVVYPFAEPCFAATRRSLPSSGAVRVLYAGRLSPEKGIYTLLAMLHSDLVAHAALLSFTATTAGEDKPQGAIISSLVEAHPGIKLVSARRTPEAMALLMADHDVVVMPSNGQYWHETFGIVSIEAQHAGCRVVASDDGGLPETDCGAVTLVAPDDADALARGIWRAVGLGPVDAAQRQASAARFSVAQSVDELLAVIGRPASPTPAAVLRELEALALLTPPSALPAQGEPVA